jgi:hypothetical protein
LTLRKGSKSIPLRLVVDTGYDGSLMLTSPFVARNHLRTTGSKGGTALGGTTSSGAIALYSLSLRNVTIRNIDGRASTDKTGSFSSSKVDGYLGGGLLKSYVVTFDYTHGRLWLKAP